MDILNKTVFITGGASGLGAAVSRLFCAEGANIVIADINDHCGNQLVEQLGQKALFCMTDITVSGDVQNAVTAAMNKFDHIDILVNCAGIFPMAKIIDKNSLHDLDLFKKVININFIGQFDVMRLVAHKMARNNPNQEGERGVIINTSSIAAFDGPLGQAAYVSSKAAIVGLTLPAARDLGKYGIRVCTIAPGLFKTPLLDWVSEQLLTDMVKDVPFPSRLGKPLEFSALVKHIVENPMLNGETIRLDGAYRMPTK